MAFPIVAIGASAGGLEALSELISALPPHGDMAYVVVQHLGPDRKSLLSELLAKQTTMPVVEIHDDLAIEPDRVYVIPANATLSLSGERFRLARRTTSAGRHMPVDILFRSLAETRAEGAIGVVLSGGDSDGALGVRAIKHAGGITFAQEPQSARFPGMPRHAIETGCVDFVLPPAEIARELARLGGHRYFAAGASAARPDAPQEVAPTADPDEESFSRVCRKLRSVHGVDFSQYKQSTLRRRLARRMALRRADNLADYAALLEEDPAENAALYQDFLIRVSAFFRDPEAFEGLRERVFPSLTEGRSPGDPIRIWVPGCAGGEEVYSIAIGLVEYLEGRVSPTAIQIFGTDVSETAIETARHALYLENIEQEVSSERLERFFVREDCHYRVAKNIRDLCIFARHDVTRDPPFSRLHLVSCRNLLIYLGAAAQRYVMQVFHFALRPKGFLMLGPSESLGAASEHFELVDRHHRLYTRRARPAGTGAVLASGGAGSEVRRQRPASDAPVRGQVDSVQREADRLLLARHAPASLLVDEALNILQFRGETSPFLEHASGAASLNLHRVARPELLVQLAAAIAEARASGSPVRRQGLHVGELTDVRVEITPIRASDGSCCCLIVLEDGSGRAGEQVARRATVPESEQGRRLAELERELATMHQYLQARLEEHEAIQEELKSAHEELFSANEEFQSTTEELESAKEELQSANEELTTTNDELRSRNRELSVVIAELNKARERSERARAYAEAIVQAVPQGLVVLDGDLRVVRANRAFCRRFGVRREDAEGHLFGEMAAGQWNIAELIAKLRALLAHDVPVDDYEIRHTFPALGARILRLNARKVPADGERAELLLLAVEDVTRRRIDADRLREADRRKDEFLAVLAHELRNPLAPITTTLQLLRRQDRGDDAAKLLDVIERQTRRLVRLVDDLLDVARISRGRIALKREPLDLIDLARQAAEATRARIEERQHTLTLELGESPLHVEGDPVRLEQIVSNLLDNAAKYAPPGGRISLQLGRCGGDALLSVRDSGVGLAEESLEAIFEPFMQLDTPPARAGEGLGIGLTLVRRLVELHGGRIEAHSAGVGRGSEFIVRLPLLSPEPTAPQPAASGRDRQRAPLPVPARRVLIVDDSPDAAESLALLLRAWEHEVAVARDGPSALTLARSFRPQIALVDIGLPGMSGYELARHLRAERARAELYLVALTGFGQQDDRARAEAAGFDLHLVKPAEADELQAVLASDKVQSGS